MGRPLTVKVGSYSSVVGGGVHIHEPDGRFAGQIAIMCQTDTLRDKALQQAMCEVMAKALGQFFAMQAAPPTSRGDAMTHEFQGWTPPPGVEVVDPPVANWQEVDLIFSDRSELLKVRAGSQNWSSVGDGPCVVAYAIVEEYKPAREPKEFWIVDRCEAYDNERDALDAADALRYKCSVIHVREVLPHRA